MSWLDFPMKFQ